MIPPPAATLPETALRRAPVAVISPGARAGAAAPPLALPHRRSARGALGLGLIGLVLLLGGFGSWAVAARIAGAVVAPGQVEVERHNHTLQHPGGGVVETVAIRDGQLVAAGELLLRLDGTLPRSELAIVEAQYFELLARRGRLEAERADRPGIGFPAELTLAAAARPEIAALMQGQARLFTGRRETLEQAGRQWDQQAQQVRNQIAGIDAQAQALRDQQALIGQELSAQRSLFERGLAPAARVLALEREQARLAGLIGEMQSQHAQAGTRLAEIGIARLKAAAERREAAEAELRQLAPRELELAERRQALAAQIARLEIRAPVAGVVHQLRAATPGAVLRPAEPVLSLVPLDRPRVIAARIPPARIGHIAPGQPAVLRLPGAPARQPPIEGRVERISADVMTDPATGQQFYRAEVAIPPPRPGQPDEGALIPGMPVEVHFQTGSRSPLSYLLQPLTDQLGRALREP
ncbi:MAG TPA: HlyD family type I secretion periplasmic adaptor subunit [Paracoccus solventivorans]|uniref:Membrane fusion protein (MFP) family protein n=1 Tax=Paracoccus solventivorans TaxID=53463 RepID=A0A832PML7_9RHOB|nr:HlyD family type I secretion periplasmic adaptor subunit [Paracoccus solventivorans]HHW34168.1 HlyD family type I secretion periplasmic adaptor subunit [Paracoccus solventivorans]